MSATRVMLALQNYKH